MSAVRQIGIKMVVDAQSVTTELPRAAREFGNMGSAAEQASTRATRSLAQVQMSVRDIVAGAAGLHVVGSAIQGIANAITALPRNAFDFSKQLEVSQVGMAGILGSMTAIDGKQTDYNTALRISSDMIRKLNDDALRTAATSQELTTVFQALLAPGLSARMTLDEIRQLTVVGTNAVKSMGLESTQVVQELRDLVAGGITPASSTLATALGLKDSDIAKARASSEGLFAFLMERMKGFEASSEAFGNTFKGKLDQLKEGATRVAADGLEPLIEASKKAVGEVANLFVTIDKGGSVTLNPALVGSIKEYATTAAQAMAVGQEWAGVLWENRDAAIALGSVWAGIKLGGMVADTVAAVAAKTELAQASRLAAAQAAAEAAGNVEVAATSRQKVAAYLAELGAKAASAQADVAAQAAQIAILTTTREAIVLSRAEVVAKMEATRVTMAQAEAQIVAARAAGAQSIALALVREGTEALTAAQARHALLLNELAVLGKQQASVNAAVAAATAAQTAATTAATTAASGLAAAQGAASIAGRALSGAVGFLGGPIGIVTTALTLGVTAWSLWGNAGSANERKVQGEVARSTAEIVADLDKQIAKLGARNALAAAGMGELAKKGGEAAERMAALQGQINNLQSGKGLDGGAPLPEVARVDLLQKLLVQYGTLAGTVQRAEEAQTKLDKGAGNLTLTAANAEQAWRKTIDGAKTATAAHDEFKQKVDASRLALEAFKKTGAAPEAIKGAEKAQAESEQAWGAERDRKIKEMGSGSATAQSHALSAQIEAIKQGYKKIAAQTADGLDEIDSLRKQDLISEYAAVERRTALKLQDIDAQESALQRELQLARGKKDSATEQARLAGQLDELTQKRVNISNQGGRDLDELIAKPLIEATNANVKAAGSVKDLAEQQEAANAVFGKSKTAIEEMTLAQLQNKLAEAEGSDRFTSDYIASLNTRIAAQKRYVDALNGADFKTLMGKEQDWLDQAKERASLYEDESKLAGLTALQRAKIVATRQIELKLAKELAEIDKASLSDVEKDKLRIKAREAAAIDSSAAVNKVIQDDAAKSAEQIQQSLTDAIMRGGKSGAEYVEDLFRTMVLRPLISAIMAPVSGVINGAVNAGMSAIGLGGGAGSGGGLLGMANNASSLNTLYGAGTQLMTGSAVGATGASLAYANGVGMLGGDAIGALASANGMWAGVATGAQATAQAAVAANLALEAGTGVALEAGTLAAAATPAAGGAAAAGLAAIPVYGWVALAAIAAFAIFSGDDSIPSVSNGGTSRSYDKDGKVESEAVGQWGLGNAGGMTDKLAQNYTSAQALLMSTGGSSFSFGSHTGDNNENPEFRMSGGSGDKVYDSGLVALTEENMAREGSRAVLAALQSSEMPASVAKFFDGLIPAKMSSEQIDEAVKAAAAFIAQVKAMGPALDLLPLENLKDLSFDAAAGLAQAAGGFGNLSSGLTSYMDNFVSDGEQRATKFRQITAALNAAGADLTAAQVMGASRRDFSDYRSAIDVTTEEGQKLLAAVLSVSGAFAELTPELMSVADITGGLSKIIVEGLQSGDAAGAGQLFADTLIFGVQDALYQGFAEQVTSMISDQLVSPLVTALVTGASINEAVSDASIAAMVAQATAAAQALNALMTDSTFQSALGQISAAVNGAVSGSISIAGAGYRPVSAPSRGSYSSGSSGGGSGGGSGSAGDRIKDEWKSICDSLVDEMKRVRGEVAGDGPQGVAYAQSAFAIATAQARAGDQDAAKSLPQLNRAYLELVGSNASSALELRRAQAAQLASLEATNSLLGKKYGITVPAFEAGGDHMGGWRLVGERGPELEATGASRIFNADQTRSFFGGGGSDNAELLGEVRMLRTVLSDVLTATRLGTGYTRDIETILAKVTEKGSAMRSKTVTA